MEAGQDPKIAARRENQCGNYAYAAKGLNEGKTRTITERWGNINLKTIGRPERQAKEAHHCEGEKGKRGTNV